MKVLHVITGINRGGAENHLVDLVTHQRASGMTVSVAYLRGSGYWAPALGNLGVEVHDLGLNFYGELKPLVRLRRVIKTTTFDLLHAHLPPAELYSRLALLGSSRRVLPLLITKHNEERFYQGPGQRLIGRWTARRATRVIAISESVKRYMAGPELGIPEWKLQTIPYGIDGTRFADVPAAEVAGLREQWNIPANALTIGFVGRLVEQKDIGTLIRGFALFSKRFPNARLVIVGAGPCETALRRCAEDLRVVDRVVWAGFREDIQTVMRAFDVFALTSIYEGFGLVLLEAMAAGKPVVATLVSAIPEVVIDGETGFLAEPRSPDSIAAALVKLGDVTLRAQLGSAGCRRAFEHFTLERMGHETDALYARSTGAFFPTTISAVPDASVDGVGASAEMQPE